MFAPHSGSLEAPVLKCALVWPFPPDKGKLAILSSLENRRDRHVTADR